MRRSGPRTDHRHVVGRCVLVGALVACIAAGCGASRKSVATTVHTDVVRSVHRRPVEWRLAASITGRLGAPLQDAAPAAARRSVVLLGGLTSADTSTDGVIRASASGAHTVGRLPSAIHDAAAANLAGQTYVFGGGNGVTQLDQIVRAPATSAGHLPRPSSDQTAATIGGTAYVVGGYTGTQWLDTIVAFDPHRAARVVAHLPAAVRYAAVTASRGRLIVAGGSLPNGTASKAIYTWTPGERRGHLFAQLPAATTHAAAAALGEVAYIVGGRGASVGTPTDRIVAVNVRTGTVRIAGRLPVPTSDAPAATLGDHIVVFGGSTVGGTTDAIVSLVRRSPASSRRAATTNVYAADATVRLPRCGATRASARLRPEQSQQHGRRDRSAHLQDRRAFHRRSAPPARDPVVGPEDALRPERPGQQPDDDQPDDREARAHDPGRRSLQHVLHAQRPVCDRRRRTAASPRLPRTRTPSSCITRSSSHAQVSTTWTSRPTVRI